MTTNKKPPPENTGDAASEDRRAGAAPFCLMTCGIAQMEEAPMDEYDHLTDSQLDLYDRMSEISEDCHCASWIIGNEYVIWEALTSSDSAEARGGMNPRLLKRCQMLSVEIDGWIFWADTDTRADSPCKRGGPRFAPMAQWIAMVDEKRKLAAAQKS